MNTLKQVPFRPKTHLLFTFYSCKQVNKACISIVLTLCFTNIFAQQITDTSKLHQIVRNFVKLQVQVKSISQVVVSPDGKFIVCNADGPDGSQVVYSAPISHPDKANRITAAPADKFCNENEPQWSPDGTQVAFLSDAHTKGQAQIFVKTLASPDSARQLTRFDGYVSHLRWSPDGKSISVLYVDKATREPNPMAAENRTTGIIDSLASRDIQRIAVTTVASPQARLVSPPGLYIFEYDWSPDSRSFAYTAALPPGDDNWYIAKLYRQSIAVMDSTLVYAPHLQIALPRWSPDGRQIGFIEGLMSDQGGTGGEIYTVAAAQRSKPVNLTPGRRSTPAWFTWRPDGSILFTEFVGGSTALCTLNTSTAAVKQLWVQPVAVQANNEETSISVSPGKGTPVIAYVRTEWDKLPEIWAGSLEKQQQLTHLNAAINLPMPKAQSITWTSDRQQVQGWLLYPKDYDPAKKYPMLVMVHGGPAWIAGPTWSSPNFNATAYTQMGYFIFLPNARGSYGQGEAFTQANRRDWGFGDLRDILAGIDTITRRYPVDNGRLGLMGWSYGGSMAMFAVTQTNRFKAVAAGAGAADWLSYYGQNSIDKWMNAYFNASPYTNPEAYRKVSAMTYITQAKTPTLVLVGEYDGECPPAQSLQYWHALRELRVPTKLVIYPDEGHDFFKLEDTIDVTLRTIDWFTQYLKK